MLVTSMFCKSHLELYSTHTILWCYVVFEIIFEEVNND